MRSLLCFILLPAIFSIAYGIPKPIKESINELPKANLTRRPLNLYITANGVHVKPEERKVEVDSKEYTYTYSQPPFAIKTRGLIFILTLKPELYSNDRPSLLQMLAASGHRTLLIDLNTVSTTKVPDFIEKLVSKESIPSGNLFSIIADYSAQDLIAKAITSKKWENLESTVLIGFDSKNLNKLSNLKIPTLILGNTVHQEFRNSQTLPITNSAGEFSKDEIMHILQNFLDLLHVR